MEAEDVECGSRVYAHAPTASSFAQFPTLRSAGEVVLAQTGQRTAGSSVKWWSRCIGSPDPQSIHISHITQHVVWLRLDWRYTFIPRLLWMRGIEC